MVVALLFRYSSPSVAQSCPYAANNDAGESICSCCSKGPQVGSLAKHLLWSSIIRHNQAAAFSSCLDSLALPMST
jgi:hypothetical protein